MTQAGGYQQNQVSLNWQEAAETKAVSRASVAFCCMKIVDSLTHFTGREITRRREDEELDAEVEHLPEGYWAVGLLPGQLSLSCSWELQTKRREDDSFLQFRLLT